MPYLCVFSIAGCLVLVRQFKKLNQLISGVIVSCCFMLAWRLYTTLASERYAVTLILPAIVLGCYAVVHLEILLPFLPQKYIKFIKLVLIIALPAGLLAKSWHFDPYYNSLRGIGMIARNDAANFSNTTFFSISAATNRFHYYSGLAPDEKLFQSAGKTSDKFGPLNDLKHLADSNLVVYIVADLKPQEVKKLESILRNLPGKTEFLGKSFVNRKKKKAFVLYRYDSFTTAASDTSAVKKNIYRNPGFENVIPLRLTEKTTARFAQSGQKFLLRRDLLIPQHISIEDLPGYENFSNAEIEAESVDPISGKYSLRIKSDDSVFVALPHDTLKGAYEFRIAIKCLQNSKIEFYLAKFNPYMTGLYRIASRTFAGDDRILLYHFPISETVSGDCHHFWVVIKLKYGEIIVDDLFLGKR